MAKTVQLRATDVVGWNLRAEDRVLLDHFGRGGLAKLVGSRVGGNWKMRCLASRS